MLLADIIKHKGYIGSRCLIPICRLLRSAIIKYTKTGTIRKYSFIDNFFLKNLIKPKNNKKIIGMGVLKAKATKKYRGFAFADQLPKKYVIWPS